MKNIIYFYIIKDEPLSKKNKKKTYKIYYLKKSKFKEKLIVKSHQTLKQN